jgi:hypothetical protein
MRGMRGCVAHQFFELQPILSHIPCEKSKNIIPHL